MQVAPGDPGQGPFGARAAVSAAPAGPVTQTPPPSWAVGPAGHPPLRPAPAAATRRRLWPWVSLALAGVVAVSLIGALDGSTLRARLAGFPKPPADAQATRIMPAVVVPDTPGRYAYLQTLPDGSPVTYDPCRPIHVVINPAGAPEGGEEAVRKALSRLSAATGLAFVIDGYSDEVPLSDRPDIVDGAWAPVLIGWGTEQTEPRLAGSVAGLGGSVAVSVSGPESARYVTGDVLLDADAMRSFGTIVGHRDQESVALHELAHVLGLDHVPADSELMSATYLGKRDLGPGDLAGLARLGQGSCHTDT